MILSTTPPSGPAHNISVWTPKSPEALHDFCTDSLDEAVDFAERVFELPQVGKVEVWRDKGRFDWEDYIELEKDWHSKASAERYRPPPSFRQRLFWLIEDWFGYEFAMRVPDFVYRLVPGS